jgi:hypothetical protein
LQRAKNQEQASFVYGQDSIFREAELLGVYQMLGNYKMIDDYLTQIDKVTPADIQRVAKKYLVESNRTVGILVPTGVLRHEMAGGGAGGAVHHAAGLGVNDPDPLPARRLRPLRPDERERAVSGPLRYLEASEVVR